MDFKPYVTLDLVDERMDELTYQIQNNLSDFIVDELSVNMHAFRKKGGCIKSLMSELTAIIAHKANPTPDTWYLINTWSIALFSSDIGTRYKNSLLCQAYCAYIFSDFIKKVAQRFHSSVGHLEENTKPEDWFCWFAFWLNRNFPGIASCLMSDIHLKRFRHFQDIPIQQVFDYLPEFMIWDMAEIIGDKKSRWLAKGLAEGNSLRLLSSCPMPFTKKMAHYFINAPRNYNFNDAVWYALCSGNIRLQTAFGKHFRNWKMDTAFIIPLINFFKGPGITAEQDEMPDLLGYLQHKWDEEKRLDIKGWTLASLRRRVQEWYDEIARNKPSFYRADIRWGASGYQPYEAVSDDAIYKILELTTAQQLAQEGTAMRHCVGTYVHKCLHNQTSIWSLRVFQAEHSRSLVTIEINKHGTIVQARSKRNAAPKPAYKRIIRKWVEKEGLKY